MINVLIARARTGDEAALEQLYRSHVEMVYRIALRISGNHSDAEDLTQESFLAAFSGLEAFRGESSFGTWIHRIATRVAWAGCRREQRMLWLSLDEVDEPVGRVDPIGERLDLSDSVARLPPGARAVLVLHEIEGLRYQEIADRLEVSVGTVKSQLHRARALLMERLQ